MSRAKSIDRVLILVCEWQLVAARCRLMVEMPWSRTLRPNHIRYPTCLFPIFYASLNDITLRSHGSAWEQAANSVNLILIRIYTRPWCIRPVGEKWSTIILLIIIKIKIRPQRIKFLGPQIGLAKSWNCIFIDYCNAISSWRTAIINTITEWCFEQIVVAYLWNFILYTPVLQMSQATTGTGGALNGVQYKNMSERKLWRLGIRSQRLPGIRRTTSASDENGNVTCFGENPFGGIASEDQVYERNFGRYRNRNRTY